MSDRKSIVSDPEIVRARAMETLFERLESLCEGAIAIDRAGRVVYVNEKYLHSLRLNHVSEAIGRNRDHPQQPDAASPGRRAVTWISWNSAASRS